MAQRQETYSADGDVTKRVLRKREEILIATAGISLALADADKEISRFEHDTVFTNLTSGYATLRSNDKFLGAGDSIVIHPYESVRVRSVLDEANSVYYWRVIGQYTRSDVNMLTWVPTLAFTTATPTLASETYEAWVQDGVCYFLFDIYTTDGAGATALTITVPIRPKDTDLFVPIEARIVVDGSYTDVQGYIEMEHATNTTRTIIFNAMPTWTDDKSVRLQGCGWYEVAGGAWEAWVPTIAYGTSNWDTVTTVARNKCVDGVGFVALKSSSADAKGVTSSVSFTPPTFPLDTSNYVAFNSLTKCTDGGDAIDYNNNFMYLDSDNATESSRLAATKAVGVMANGKAAVIYCSGIYEQYGWKAWTPTLTFTGTAPAVTSKVGRYKIVDGICYFNIYYARTADTAAPTALVISGLPVSPKNMASKIPIIGHQLVNTTYSNCMPIIYADQAAEADRTIQFQNLSTFTASVAGKLFIAGWYPVG